MYHFGAAACNKPDRFLLQLQPLRNISGLKWGNYVGSPDWPDPVLSWLQPHGSAVSSLVALPTGEVFGLGPNSCLIVMYSKEKGMFCQLHYTGQCFS